MSSINLLKWVIYKQKYSFSQSPPSYSRTIYFLIVQDAQFGRTMFENAKKLFLADHVCFFLI